MRKLKKKEIELLTKLKEDNDLSGRGHLRAFIIRNTYEPKYKVGDYVKVTDNTYSYIWGNRIVNVNAEITEIKWWLQEKGKEFVQYSCIAYDQDGKDYFLCAEESIDGSYQSRHITGRSRTNKNKFEKKTKYSQSTEVML